MIQPSDAPVVPTSGGRVRGLVRPGSTAFLGIPFAEPPVGDRRFAAPVRHAGWRGIRDASAYGATPQRTALSEVTLIPEPSIPGDSTLNVNVFTPAPGDEAAKLPVLVYIHGGGFLAGSPASPWYDGAAFNRDGVVTVSVSYRLGFDGFGWIEDAPNNRAILDWLLALEWVRDNIAHFGGDPERVTIAGQSAGGGAVLSLLAVPRAEGLFHAAISLSGVVVDTPLDEAEAMGRRLASLGGVAPTRAGFAGLDESTILDLQAKVAEPAPEQDGGEDPLGPLVAFASGRALNWGPVVDGDVYPSPLEEAYRSGASAGIPLVLGATDQEFSMALADQHDALAAVPASAILARTGRSPETVAAYLEGRQGDTADVIGQYITDMTFRTVALRLARARQAAPTWLYRFAWVSPSQGSACHCLDVPFFFDCLGSERVDHLAGENPPQSLADDVHGAAVRFIASGDPGWDRFEGEAAPAWVFDTPSHHETNAYADVDPLLEGAAG